MAKAVYTKPNIKMRCMGILKTVRDGIRTLPAKSATLYTIYIYTYKFEISVLIFEIFKK